MDPLARAKRLRALSEATVRRTRGNLLRARAVQIQALHLAQTARATVYENHLIRRLKP